MKPCIRPLINHRRKTTFGTVQIELKTAANYDIGMKLQYDQETTQKQLTHTKEALITGSVDGI